MRLPWLRLAIVSFIVFPFAQGAWAATDAEKMLEKAFDTYCATLKPQPTLCAAGASLDRKYLFLEPLCQLAPSPPDPCAAPQDHCGEFKCAVKLDSKGHLVPLVIALDHETGRWEGRNRLAGAGKGRLEMDVAGQPTVSLSNDERIVVVVENTNPLLYSAVPGKPTEIDIPELEQIQKLISAVGGGLVSSLKMAAMVKSTLPEMAETASVEDVEPLEAYRAKVEESLKAIRKAALTAECRTGQATEQTRRAIAFVQALELGSKDDSYLLKPLLPPSCSGEREVERLNHADTAEAFSALQAEVFQPQNRPEECGKLFEAALGVLAADSTDPEKVLVAVRSYEEVLPGCPDFEMLKAYIDNDLGLADIKTKAMKAAALGRQAKINADRLKHLSDLTSPSPEEKAELKVLKEGKADAQKALVTMERAVADRQSTRDLLLEVSSVAKQLAALRTKGEEVLAKRGDAEKAAAQVEEFERRVERYRLRGSDCSGAPCVKTEDIDPRIVLEPQLTKVRSTKIQKHSLTVKTDSAYAGSLVATRPAELKAEFNLDSVLRGLWGISASAIYTDLANPTFGAVTSADDPMKMVIAQTDEETRAGEIALLADFRLARWLACRREDSKCNPKWNWFGVEVGAGVSDEAAFFAGLSFRPSRSWRFGVGYTYQQVTELNGQNVGDVVASGDDIKTRDDFDGELYFSLSFALDSLSLFSSGD